MNKRTQDHWGRKARRDGYAARSVYKLEDIDRKVHLFRPGMRVLDLGAFPGSWTVYAAQRVGPRGQVLGLDLQAPRQALPPNAEMRQQDVMAADLAQRLAGRRWDVVLSDMAPSTSGHRLVDQARSFALAMRALELATQLLAPGGSFVAKIFQGPDFDEARRRVGACFERVRIVRPPATRAESIETFLVGLRFRGPSEPSAAGSSPAGSSPAGSSASGSSASGSSAAGAAPPTLQR